MSGVILHTRRQELSFLQTQSFFRPRSGIRLPAWEVSAVNRPELQIRFGECIGGNALVDVTQHPDVHIADKPYITQRAVVCR